MLTEALLRMSDTQIANFMYENIPNRQKKRRSTKGKMERPTTIKTE
jgi:hypothetical protein